MIEARRFYQDGFKETGKTLSLFSLLIRAYASNTSSLNPSATDPGDIVFALIGLTYDAKIHGMNPDRKSERTVYIETAAMLLMHGYIEV
jgi:hypothetical protein